MNVVILVSTSNEPRVMVLIVGSCGAWQSLPLTLCYFTFWISLSLRLSLSPKFGLRPKMCQKVKSFFLWTWRALGPKFDLSDQLIYGSNSTSQETFMVRGTSKGGMGCRGSIKNSGCHCGSDKVYCHLLETFASAVVFTVC